MTHQKAELTFKYNQTQGRNGWLRLTPAYSVKLVTDILASLPAPMHVLDPFSGSGSTGVVCAERGIACDLIDINPFLVWLAQVKTATYTAEDLAQTATIARAIAAEAQSVMPRADRWVPPLFNIERWWSHQWLQTLAALYHLLCQQRRHMPDSAGINLLCIAFCRVMIDWSNAAFDHQSMSFKETQPSLFVLDEPQAMIEDFVRHSTHILSTARDPFQGHTHVYAGDSRRPQGVVDRRYDCVITSPPYPNRMSYIRELRPYMYWLGFLDVAREAGDLDWQVIGGTWGVATSRLTRWTPDGAIVTHAGFEALVGSIAERSPLLANYVHKYFIDITTHLANVTRVLMNGATVHYIVGNSKFYDTLVPVEEIYVSILRHSGFQNVETRLLRKRNSKSELFEYVVTGQWV